MNYIFFFLFFFFISHFDDFLRFFFKGFFLLVILISLLPFYGNLCFFCIFSPQFFFYNYFVDAIFCLWSSKLFLRTCATRPTVVLNRTSYDSKGSSVFLCMPALGGGAMPPIGQQFFLKNSTYNSKLQISHILLSDKFYSYEAFTGRARDSPIRTGRRT